MFSWIAPTRKPIIVAHRGSSITAPENTLAAFRQAVLDEADAIELDVHLSKDGQAVVTHDGMLHRTTRGRGRVSEWSVAELKELSAGAWFGKKFTSETIPTLPEVFDAMRGRVGINIEIKTDPHHRRQSELIDRCCDIVERYSASRFVLISSFSRAVVKHVKITRPQIVTGLLYHPVRHVGTSPVDLARSIGTDYLILNGTTIRKRIIRRAHEEGILVGEYTVNARWRVARAIRFEVDAIITDDPSTVRKRIAYC
ncbi:MAG: hypothetical protein HYR76_00645 [Ignavibacteria bacterium]|nr:hypothetical protein [Ignavibacteria bacterium]MBI3765076.1 hypothetical protein [Ignavibacteriales bacterium]